MSTPDPGTWQRTSPFAILFFIGRFLRLIARNAWQSLAPLFALLVAYQGDLVNKAILGGAAFAVVLTTSSVLSYWFFRFQLLGDSILIREGVIRKKQLDIKFERIQGVNTEQNIVYRYLGLVTMSFDTAGSKGSEGNLPAVTHGFAEALRARISRASVSEQADIAEDKPAANALLHLDWRDMIRIGLADRRALILFAFIGPLLERMENNIEQVAADFVAQAAVFGLQIDFSSGAWIVLAVALLLTIVLLLTSIAGAFLRYNNFQLFLDGRALRSTSGLLTRHEHAMDLSKIQTLRLQQGIVQRWLGRYEMTARQAVSGGRRKNQKVFDIPVVTAAMADQLRTRLLAPEAGKLTQDPTSRMFASVSPHYMRSRILFVGVLPALLTCVALWAAFGAISLLVLGWIPLVVAFAYRSWRRAGYLHDDHEIVRRSGLLGYRTVALLFRKIQRVSITQSRYQRRKDLASLQMYMASGSVRIPYIEHARAKQLRDYILYKVESSQQSWH